MRFYPPKNEEIDQVQDIEYLKKLLKNWRTGLNLVTRFDIVKGKIYHLFMKAQAPDLNHGILRVWKKTTVNRLYDNLIFKNSEKKSIFNKLDMIDEIFNRNEKLYTELSEEEKYKAYANMMINAREHFNIENYILAAYYVRGAMLYKNTPKAQELLSKCRQECLFRKVA